MNGVDQIKVKHDATLIFSHPAVTQGPLYIHSGANAIKWAYHLNTQSTPTLGGEVVQVLSALVGPMQIAGQTAGLKVTKSGQLERGEVKGWKKFGGNDNWSPNDELKAIVDWFREYMTKAGTISRQNQKHDERAVHFTYPVRGWDFWIIPTSIDGFRYDKEVISPEWSITAEVISDNALNFFSGITMSSFNDDILTNQALIGRLGLSAFAKSGTETSNFAFGQTGDKGSTDPFLNPDLSTKAVDMARKMGDNFQSLVSAWGAGSFADFGFGALLDNGALPKNVDQVYSNIFGSPYLALNTGGPTGSTSGTGGTTTRGSYTYSGSSQQDNIAAQIANAFSNAGMPPELGIATALLESTMSPDAANSSGHLGLFQNGISEGRAPVPQAAVTLWNNWNKQGTRLSGLSDAYPVALQISQAAGWFPHYAPAGAGANTTDPAVLQQWAIAAQGVTLQNNPLYGSFASTFIPQARNLLAQLSKSSGGGSVSASAATARQFYRNPFRDVPNLMRSPDRPTQIDEGVDYSGDGPVYALGNGIVVTAVYTSGWSGGVGLPPGGYLSYRLTDGPAAGKTVYIAENISILVKPGDKVTSSTVICTMASPFPHIETGWSQPSGSVAMAAGQSGMTAFGANFASLLRALGESVCIDPSTLPISGTLPSGWPRWA